ncbi:MAG: ABC transporter permease [Chitinophagaceae bacterium]|nr:ABC transporter permease [Chitinophagaceae bacterium]
MNKTWLIIKREYLTRVRNRTFIISTFLTPLFFVGLIAAIVFISPKDMANQKTVREAEIVKENMAKNEKSGVAYGVGYASSFLIYISILIYGTMVMRGVSEEKTNRIAEIIISSVKPFQLMMGKIIGIGAVGLTQFIMWLVLVVVFVLVLFTVLPPDALGEAGKQSSAPDTAALQASLMTINLPLILFCFLFYFIFGYLFYASLFAAVGSAVSEDAQDTQSLLLPVTMPVILAIAIMVQVIMKPVSSLATWSSMVPFFSPVVMMARIPFGVPGTVPWWELIASMLLLVAGFLFITWLSAKIYRTGILLYGKKTTWKEMWKWTLKRN